MLHNYTLKTQIDLIELEELELELEIINQLENSKEPSKECLNAIMQYAAAFNIHTTSMINDVSYMAN
jgi:hypothetical protein